MDYVEPDEFDYEELELEVEDVDVDEVDPVDVVIHVTFKSGAERSIAMSLPLESQIVDATLTGANILDYIGSAYQFSEGAFLALPTDRKGSHVFIEIAATDSVEVMR